MDRSVNAVDLLLLGIFAFTMHWGFRRGLVRQIAALGSLLLGVVLAGRYHRELASHPQVAALGARYGTDTVSVLCYLGIFAASVLSGLLGAALLRRAMRDRFLHYVDSAFGGLLGLGKSYAACGLVALGILLFVPNGSVKYAVSHSYLAPRMARSMHSLIEKLPMSLRETFHQIAVSGRSYAAVPPSQAPPRKPVLACIARKSR